MRTVLVSDLHLGTRSGVDAARHAAVRRRLMEHLQGAEQIVLLGDVLELREAPVAEVLAATAPFFAELADAAAGQRVVIVPGNHDHQLVVPLLERTRLKGTSAQLGVESVVKPGRDGLAAALARRLPGIEVTIAYPGLFLRPDVYATHGHYLDCHLTVPRAECLAAAVMERLVAGSSDGASGASRYEAALAPLYAFLYNLSQGTPTTRRAGGDSAAVRVWTAVNGRDGRRSLTGRLLGGLVIPGAVSALNRAGLGPFRADISGLELYRAGLRAMAEVVERLGVEADHVVFGHTHRQGPRPGESEGWTLPGGARLTNTGSWVYERAFLEPGGPASPYWPGSCVELGDTGPPELRTLLADLSPEELGPP